MGFLLSWKFMVPAVVIAVLGAYAYGRVDGAQIAKAQRFDTAVKALEKAAKDVGKVQTTLDNLTSIDTRLSTTVRDVTALFPEIDARLQNAKVLADCRPLTAADVAGLRRAFSDIDTQAGLSPAQPVADR